ncbi:MAG: hypothetical protein QG573_1745 [Acidobacteriota bacterium]|nr:hypothetical protein [Acidobacteriota bacterium]
MPPFFTFTSALRHKRWRGLAFVALGTLALGLPAAASAPRAGEFEVGLGQLGFETWTTDQGLAGNRVRDIAETPDGFLWIATSGGLSRFDGRQFLNFTAASDAELPTSQVSSLAVGPDGELWIGFETGGVRVSKHGRLATDPRLAALPPAPVASLAVDSAGTLWIGTERGLFRATSSGLENVAPSTAGATAEIRRVTRAPEGGIWVRTRLHGIWRAEGGGAKAIDDAPECLGHDVSALADGGLVTTCASAIWERRSAAEAWHRLASDVRSARHLVDHEGGLWYADSEGLKRRRRVRPESMATADRLGDHRVLAFLEDSRGEIWIGSFAGGLARLRRGAALAAGEPEGLPVRGTTALVAGAEESIWMGSWKDGLYRWHPQKGLLGHWGSAEGLPSGAVWALAEDPRHPGHLWVGTAAGLYELEAGRVRRLERPEGRTAEPVRLLVAEEDRLWVGGETGGLDEHLPGGVRRHDARNGLELDRVSALQRDSAGGLFAGGDRGLYRLEGASWRKVDLGLKDFHTVRALARGTKGGLWIASDSLGLVHASEGAALVYGERQGLPFNQIFSLELDSFGGLWLSGNQGLFRIDVEDFERWTRGEIAKIPTLALDGRDGLRERECNGWGRPASTRFPDGRLAYPTLDGVAIVDPERVSHSTLLPTEIFISGAATGSRLLFPQGTVRLGTEERHLRVHFGAIEFERPEAVAFRVHLEGAGRDWVPAAAANEAEFAYLPPGGYRFRLQARLPGQDWVEAASSLSIVVRPKLWESDAFRLFVMALTAAAALALFFWRTRIERHHAVELERERSLLRDVIDISPNPIFAKSRDLTYSLANRAAAEIYGLEPRDVLERSDAELAHRARGIEQLDALDREVLDQGAERIVPEARLVDAAGRTRWFRVVKRPRLAPSGEVDQVIGTAVDVTDFKAAEEQLRRHEAELEASREELRRLARELLVAQEEERRRLARELHDDLTQRVAGLAMLVGGLAQAVERGRAQNLSRTLGDLGRELESLASDTQALSRELHPALLESLGLEEALRTECATFGERSGLRIRFESQGVPSELARETSFVLYRISQEALRNAVEHSQAGEAVVRLVVVAGELELEIVDSGIGFDPSEPRPGAGLGLVSMAERARLIAARFEIDSAPGRGTRISVRVALTPDPGRLERESLL